jgi:hypothetical protein
MSTSDQSSNFTKSYSPGQEREFLTKAIHFISIYSCDPSNENNNLGKKFSVLKSTDNSVIANSVDVYNTDVDKLYGYNGYADYGLKIVNA